MARKDIDIIIRAFDRTSGGTSRSVNNLARVKVAAKAAAVAVGVMATAAAAMAVRAGKAFVDTADKTAKMGRRLGITTEELSTLEHAANLTGVEINTLSTGLQRMTRRVAEAAQGTGEAKAAIAELGLDAQELARLSPDEQFRRIADAMEDVSNQGDRVRLAMKLFDTEGVALLQTMEGGAEAIRAMQQEARDLGIEISTNTGRQAEALNDNMLRLQGVVTGAGRAIAAELLPGLVQSTNDFVEWSQKSLGASKQAALLSSLVARLGSAMALTGELSLITMDVIEQGFKQGTLAAEGMFHKVAGLFSDSETHGKAFIDVLQEMENEFIGLGVTAVSRLTFVKQLMDNLASPTKLDDIQLPKVTGGGFEEESEEFEEQINNNKQAVQSFHQVGQQAFQNLASGLGRAALSAENMSQAVADLGKGIAQMFIDYIAQRLAVVAFEKTMGAIGLATAATTATGMAGLGAAVTAAWLPAATAVSLATFGANAAPAIQGMFAAFAAGTGLASLAGVAGGLLSGSGGIAGQAHAGLDMVPREGTYLLNRGEAVLQPEANQDLRAMASDYNRGGGGGMMARINIMLDGDVLASSIGKLSRDGVLEIHPRAVR